MTLAELSEAWSELRNAALGRGVAPLVTPSLAARVGTRFEAWRVWLGQQAPIADMAASVTARAWVSEYRQLAAAVKSEGIKFRELPATTLELAGEVVETSKSVLFVAGVAAVGVAMLAWRVKR